MEFHPHHFTEASAPKEEAQTWWPLVDDEPEVAKPGKVETVMTDPEGEKDLSPPDSAPARQNAYRIRKAPKTLTRTLGRPTFS